MSLGPILYLRWFGQFLPCLEKEEDRKARQALVALNQAGTSIAWYPKGSSDNSANAATQIGANVVNFFKSAISRTSSSTSMGSDSQHNPSNNNNSDEPDCAPATFMIRDNPDTEKPEIFVDPLSVPIGPGKKKKQPAVGYKLNIQLSRVGQVDVNPNTGIIKIMAKAPKNNDPENQQSSSAPETTVKCLITLELVKGQDVNVSASADERDMFVHHLLVLMEWERQRRVAAQEFDSIADEQAAQGGNFLTQRASQAAHFAKRELELQTTKRQRESRKAKLVAEGGGGLKYTALAMMKNAENSG